MPFDLTIADFNTNVQIARWLRFQRSFAGAGAAREVVESSGFTIGRFIEVGRRGTVPQWSAYDVGDAVVLLIDGIWSALQAGAIFAAAGLPPVELPTARVNAVAGSDAFSIWERVARVWSGENKRLLCGGYSYGGVLAEIVAVLSDTPGQWKVVESCTFGAFRPGDKQFASDFSRISAHRWMNDSDPVPKFPPHLSEAPGAVVAVGPFTASVWMQYVQPGAGLMLTPSGAFQPKDVPTARIPTADVDLVAWLTGADQGKVAGHSLDLYVSRLTAAAALVKQEERQVIIGSNAEPFFPATQQGFNAAVADAAALSSTPSAEGKVSMAYIPVQYRPKVISVLGTFQVSWMGFTICTCPTKSAAKTTAKYLFKHLRVLQGDSVTSVSQLANAWAAFWAVAVSSSLGFDPPFQVSP